MRYKDKITRNKVVKIQMQDIVPLWDIKSQLWVSRSLSGEIVSHCEISLPVLYKVTTGRYEVARVRYSHNCKKAAIARQKVIMWHIKPNYKKEKLQLGAIKLQI